jgi:hypothetical protein
MAQLRENLEFDEIIITLYDSQKEMPSLKTPQKTKHNAKSPMQELFDKLLIEAIDEALSSLGEPVKNAVYQNLESNFNIPKNKIPEKITTFSEIINKIFGLCASNLEVKSMRNLHSKINYYFKFNDCKAPLSKWIVADFSFEEYICEMRRKFESAKQTSASK